jgi:hypothetical protein
MERPGQPRGLAQFVAFRPIAGVSNSIAGRLADGEGLSDKSLDFQLNWRGTRTPVDISVDISAI